MEAPKKYGLKTFIVFLIGLISIGYLGIFFEKERAKEENILTLKKWEERIEKERIEKEREKERIKKERIENAYKYSDECRLNRECWINVSESLTKAMDKDLSDGVIDEDWTLVKNKILNNISKIVDEDFEETIIRDVFYSNFIRYNNVTLWYQNKNGDIFF